MEANDWTRLNSRTKKNTGQRPHLWADKIQAYQKVAYLPRGVFASNRMFLRSLVNN